MATAGTSPALPVALSGVPVAPVVASSCACSVIVSPLLRCVFRDACRCLSGLAVLSGLQVRADQYASSSTAITSSRVSGE